MAAKKASTFVYGVRSIYDTVSVCISRFDMEAVRSFPILKVAYYLVLFVECISAV